MGGALNAKQQLDSMYQDKWETKFMNVQAVLLNIKQMNYKTNGQL